MQWAKFSEEKHTQDKYTRPRKKKGRVEGHSTAKAAGHLDLHLALVHTPGNYDLLRGTSEGRQRQERT